MALLQIERLTYGRIKGPIVVSDFSASQNSGLIFLFGENGSGKTTMLELLCGINDMYYGEILIDGQKPKDATGQISYLPSEPVLLGSKSVMQNLIFAAENCGKTKNGIVFDEWINKRKDIKAKKLSFANKQILCIKRSQIKQPKLLLIDINLSKIAENELQNYINELQNAVFAENKLVIIACSAKDYKKLQFNNKKYCIWYQNTAKILKFDNLTQFCENIEYSNMLEYIDIKTEKGQISCDGSGYYLHALDKVIKLKEKFLKDVMSYFEVNSAVDVLLGSKIDCAHLSDEEFNKEIESGKIMLFDAITTQIIK